MELEGARFFPEPTFSKSATKFRFSVWSKLEYFSKACWASAMSMLFVFVAGFALYFSKPSILETLAACSLPSLGGALGGSLATSTLMFFLAGMALANKGWGEHVVGFAGGQWSCGAKVAAKWLPT